MLRMLSADTDHVIIHNPLPMNAALGDEGAANHGRLVANPDALGWHLMVYGRDVGTPKTELPQNYPVRQNREASQAVARIGQLPLDRVLFARQHPMAIDTGAFHNDVVMVADGDHLLLHETCLVDQEDCL